MDFCDICNNMLYVKCDIDNNLVRFCKHCDFSKTESDAKFVKITETTYSEDDLLYNQYHNKYLRYDPTLRRIKDPNINCTNPDCKIEENKKQILYIKYHPENMKYLYVCDHCGNIWK